MRKTQLQPQPIQQETGRSIWKSVILFLVLSGLIVLGILTVVRVYSIPTAHTNCSAILSESIQNMINPDRAKGEGNDTPSNNNGGDGCNNCLRPILEDGLATLDDIQPTLAQYLVYGQSTCNAQLGIYNVSSYYPLLIANYTAIIRYDNVRPLTDYFDSSRTNITYFPGVPSVPSPPGGPYSGAAPGLNLPFLVGNVLNGSKFKKFTSVPQSIGFFLNVSFLEILPTDQRLTVFLKNVEDRGPNNLEHRRYMAALTKSKVVGRYADKIKRFASNLYNSFVINKLPLLSTFNSALIHFFLDIHLGNANYPPFIVDYFSDFLVFISVTDSNADAAIRNMRGHMNSKCVREYVQDRITKIISESMTDTMTWNWIQAGMPIESVTIEAMHNIVAFSQFNNIMQLLVTQTISPSTTTPGTGGQSFLSLFKLAGQGIPLTFALPAPYYNFSVYSGTPEELQINVVREFMRIMLPNNLWFSNNVDNNCTGCSNHTQTRHIPQLIQIRGEYDRAGLITPWFPAGSSGWNTAAALYGRYDPSRYTNFAARFSDAVFSGNNTSPAFDRNDTSSGLLCTIAAFTRSAVDNETQIPSNDGSMIPVFNQPIYAPFGLGARRCPGEIFNQFVILELFKAVQCLNFYDDCKLNPTRCNPLSPDYLYTPVALAPFKAAPDSLFVSGNPTCAYPAPCA